jgi:hypothetical protein
MALLNRFNGLLSEDKISKYTEKISTHCLDGSLLDTTKWRSVDNNKYKNFLSFNKKKLPIQKDKETQNRKTLLCNNMITKKYCDYGDNCKYAHSLSEQCIDKSRKNVHDIMLLKNMSHINFQENVSLYRALLGLTKLCERENCAGGYNCKYGACGDKAFHICLRDLNHGDCQDDECKCVHLTKKGLKPFYSGSIKLSQYQSESYGITHYDTQSNQSGKYSGFSGTLLSEAYFLNKLEPLKESDYDDELLSNLSVSTTSTKTDMSDMSNEYEQSIFEEKKVNTQKKVENFEFLDMKIKVLELL